MKGPEKVRVVVDTFPKSAGVAEEDVQYARVPGVSFVEVETVPEPPAPLASDPSHKSALPVIAVQNAAHVVPDTPLKVSWLFMFRLVAERAVVEAKVTVNLKDPLLN